MCSKQCLCRLFCHHNNYVLFTVTHHVVLLLFCVVDVILCTVKKKKKFETSFHNVGEMCVVLGGFMVKAETFMYKV